MSETWEDPVEALFFQTADLPPDEQRALLDRACANDSDLRAKVERLLADDARLRAGKGTPGFLDSPLVRSNCPTEGRDLAVGWAPPERIGRYRIVRQLGEGGMGTVYEALQDHPRREVALKVIRHGLVTSGGRKRFAQEAEILGLLHHPGIAAIYERTADPSLPWSSSAGWRWMSTPGASR